MALFWLGLMYRGGLLVLNRVLSAEQGYLFSYHLSCLCGASFSAVLQNQIARMASLLRLSQV